MPTPPSIRFNSSGTYSTLGTFDEVTGTIITNGLVTYFDAGRVASYPGSGTTWFDVPGSRNATLINGPVYNSTFSGILSFSSASSRYATFSPVGLPSGASAGSMEAWVRPLNQSVGSGFQLIAAYGTAALSQARCIGYNVGYWFWAGYSNDVTFTQTITTNTWYHLVGTYDGITAIMYLNGTQVASSAKTWNTVLNSATLGAQIGPSDYLTGDIGYTAIYNRALAPYEVVRNYNAARPRFFNVSSGTDVKAKLSSTFQYYNSLDEVTYNPNNGIASNNLLSYSEDITVSPWFTIGANVTRQSNSVVAPNGTLTADTLLTSAALAGDSIYQDLSGIVGTTPYILSVFVKAGTTTSISFAAFYTGSSTEGFSINFNPVTGLITGGTGIVTTHTNGWYRISFAATGTIAANNTIRWQIYLNNTGTVYLWGAQLERSSSLGVYVATTASNVKFTTFAARTTNQGEIYVKDSFDEVTSMIVTDGLLLYLDGKYFESTRWTDLSNYNNDGTLFNSPTYNNTNSSFIFNGSTQGAQITTSTLNVPYTGKTIFVVARLSATAWTPGVALYRGICGTNGGPRNFNFYVYQDAANLIYFHYSTPGSAFLTNPVSLNTNTWFIAAVTQTASTTTVYLNGVSIYSLSGQTLNQYANPGGAEYVGRADGLWAGDIAVCAYYSRALSASEIVSNYNAFSSRVGLP